MTVENKKRILLVEDDASMRKFISLTLSNANYEVIEAADGLAAVRLVGENRLDAVIADAIMPNLTGYELCRMIRAKKVGPPVPCIIISGLEETLGDREIADAFLVKDTDLKERLLETLRELI